MSDKKKVKSIADSFHCVKQMIKDYVDENRLNELQEKAKNLAQTAKKDVEKFVGKDFGTLKKKILKERKNVEAFINKVIEVDLTKAKKFILAQKKELMKLQEKVEALKTQPAPKKKKTVKKSTTKKKRS